MKALLKALLIALLLALPLSLSAAPKDEDENPPLKQSDLPLPIVVDQSQGDVPVTLDGEAVTVTGSVDATIQEPLEVVSDAVLKFTYPNNYIYYNKSFPFVLVGGGNLPPGFDNEILLLQSQFEYMTGVKLDAVLYETANVTEPIRFKIYFIGYDDAGVLEWISLIGSTMVSPGIPVSYEVDFPMPLSTLGYYLVGVSLVPAKNSNIGNAYLTTELNMMGYKDLPQ